MHQMVVEDVSFGTRKTSEWDAVKSVGNLETGAVVIFDEWVGHQRAWDCDSEKQVHHLFDGFGGGGMSPLLFFLLFLY